MMARTSSWRVHSDVFWACNNSHWEKTTATQHNNILHINVRTYLHTYARNCILSAHRKHSNGTDTKNAPNQNRFAYLRAVSVWTQCVRAAQWPRCPRSDDVSAIVLYINGMPHRLVHLAHTHTHTHMHTNMNKHPGLSSHQPTDLKPNHPLPGVLAHNQCGQI